MEKFNVGDRVRVTEEGDFKETVGTVTEVEEAEGGERYHVCIDSRFLDFAFSADELERHMSPLPYREAVDRLMDRQAEKGRSKYGISLEENVTLTTEQRIEHLQEELLDGLMYCEHLKTALKDAGMTANDYQRAALRTAQTDKYSKNELMINGVMGLCGEAGEVIDLVKKARYQGHDLDNEKIAEEISDCCWYISLIAHAMGYKMADIFEINIEKLRNRYPEGFSKERSMHRGDSIV